MRLAIALIVLHGLDGQTIYVNPAEVVSVRAPATDLLHSDVKCTLQTADGKLINVVDSCLDVRQQIERSRQ